MVNTHRTSAAVGKYCLLVTALAVMSCAPAGGGTADGGLAGPISDEELGTAQVTFSEAGGTALSITEESGGGSVATKVVTADDSDPTGASTKVTEVTVNTGDTEYKIFYDDQERPTKVASASMEVTLTYNEDGSYNYALTSEGEVPLDGSDLALTDEIEQALAAAEAAARRTDAHWDAASQGTGGAQGVPVVVQRCMDRATHILAERIPAVDSSVFSTAFVDFVAEKFLRVRASANMLKLRCWISKIALRRLELLANRCGEPNSNGDAVALARCRNVRASLRALRELVRQIDGTLLNITRKVFEDVRRSLAPVIEGNAGLAVGETGTYRARFPLSGMAGFLPPEVSLGYVWSASEGTAGGVALGQTINGPSVEVSGSAVGPAILRLDVTFGTIPFHVEKDITITP